MSTTSRTGSTAFGSVFAAHIEALLQWRTALGYSAATLVPPMGSFDRFCRERRPGETILSRELVTASGHRLRPDDRPSGMGPDQRDDHGSGPG